MTVTVGRGVPAVTMSYLGVGRLGGRSAAAQLSPYARAALDLDASAAPSALLWQKPAEGLFSFLFILSSRQPATVFALLRAF